MLRALFSGVSGLNQNITKLDVIGNNIANVNTVGYKTARVTFSDAFSQTLRTGSIPGTNRGGVNPIQVGGGVQVQAISPLFNQGNILTTGGATDLAIQGDGFFVVNDGEQDFYTRAGTFQIDSFGRLVQSGTGNLVQGYAYDSASGTSSGSLGELTIPFNSTAPPMATDTLSLSGNLQYDSEARATIVHTGAFDDTTSGAAAVGTTLLTDLRRSGEAAQLLTAGDTIDLEATIGGTQVTASFAVGAGSTVADLLSFFETNLGIPAGNAMVAANGEIRVQGDPDLGAAGEITVLRVTAEDGTGAPRTDFNVTSSFVQSQEARDAVEVIQETTVYDTLGVAHKVRLTFTRVNDELAWSWTAELDEDTAGVLSGGSGRVTFHDDGTLNSFTFDDGSGEIVIDPGTGATTPQRLALDFGTFRDTGGMTLLAAPSSLETTQNGYASGTFVDYTIDGSGRLFALFSNGVTEIVGDLAQATFNNPSSLEKDGDNLFRVSTNSGEAVIRPANETTGTRIVVGALEQSNVDLAREFSELIITQRAFQANSRVIQSSSDILAELMQLTR